MRKMYHLLLWLFFVTATVTGYSQVSYSENFESGNLNGWLLVGGYASATGYTSENPCTGMGSARTNLYSGATSNTTTSPLLGTSNGGQITLDFVYKLADFSTFTPTPNSPAWGSILVQYSSSQTGPWNTVHTINAANHTTSATCALKTVTFNAPPGDLYVRFSSSWTGGDYYIYYDDINISQGAAPACVQPTNIDANSVTATSATISWDASISSATGYEWEIRSSGAAGSGATGLVASGSTGAATLTASTTTLTDNTTFSAYVRTNCGGTFSAWGGPFTFVTPCITATLPYIQDFESAVVPAMPSCTSTENAGTGNNWTTSNAPGSGFTSKTLQYSWNSSNPANAWFYTQPVSLTAGTSYRLRFKYGNNSTTYVEKLEVKYGVSPSSADMTDLIVDYPSISIGGQANSSTDFIPSVSGVYYIGFHVYSIANQFNLYVDDIMVMVTPTCDEPTGLMFSDITSNSVQLEWTPPAVTSPADYQIYYNTNPAPPTSGSTPNILNASSPASITSLAPGTKYYVWIRSNCGATDGVSIWTIRDSVTTECTPVTTLNENFDGVTTPALPDCWAKFLRGTAGTPNVTTSTTTPNSAPNSVLLSNSSSTSTADIMLVSPPLSNVGAGTHRLKFWARNATATQDIEVGTLDNKGPSAIFTLVQAIDINGTWTEYIVDFTSYAGTDAYIAIRRLSTSTFTSVYVDNIVWEAIPVCDAPTLPTISAITTTGANVEWTPPTIGSPVDYQVYYANTNTAPTGATTPQVTGATLPATLTGLTPNTLYYVWVRTNCGTGGVSNWSTMTSFTTACLPTNVPYSENFETATVPGMPPCTMRENAGTGNNWVTSSAPGNGFTSKTLQYGYSITEAANAWFYTQGLNLTGGQSYRITYRYGNNNASYTEKLEVKYGTSPSSASMSDLIADHPTINNASANSAVYDFTPATTEVYYIGFHIYSAANQWNLYVDDISVVVTPTCNEPTGVTISNPATNGAQVDWTPPSVGTPASYELFYNSTNTPPTASDVPTVSGVTGTSTNLTGLTPGTTYYLWMRSFCGSTDVSVWTSMKSFVTLCVPVTSFSQNFDGVTTPALPACWNKVGATGSAYTQTGSPNSTPNTLYIYSTTITNLAVVSMPPVSNLGAGTHRLTFKARGNLTAGGMIEVGYLTTPTDASTFTLFETVTVSTLTYQTYTVVPPATPGYEVMAFRHTGDPSYSVLIDDVVWEQLPSCNEPTSLQTSAVTMTDAQIDWVPPTSGTVTNYSWELRTSGAAGSGATGLVNSGNTASTTVNLTGLNAGTAYTFYVRTNCVAPDVSSYASKAFTTVIANDDCSDAIALTGNVALTATTAGATQSMPAEPCAGFTGTADDDVWFKFTATANGNATITVTQTIIDAVVLAYSGSCGATTIIGCSDVFTPNNEVISLTGLVMGTEYLVRVFSYSAGATATGAFNITVTGPAVLPVTLVDFKGEKAGSANRLIWTTSTEINNMGFELERSADGRNFTSLTFVASKAENGNSNSTLNYSYNDVRPLSGNNYYRLKQIDKDGKSTYSDIIALKSKATDITLSSVYPNPATRELNMIITSPKAEKVTIVVTDLTGKIIMQQNAQLVIGDNQSQMNVQQLAAGTYLVKAICANGCETAVQRFVKH